MVEKKGFPLTNLAISNKTSVFLLTVLLSLYGLNSYNSMPRETFPDIVIPKITISTSYPGNAPVSVEKLVTRQIEKEVKSVSGLKTMTSSSFQDHSIVVAEFLSRVPISEALQRVKDAVDQSKANLPEDLPKDPTVSEVNVQDFPVMFLNLSGEYSLKELQHYADELEDLLEQNSKVSKVQITGIDDREVQVVVNLQKLLNSNLSFQDISNAILSENVAMGAGEINNGSLRISIRVESSYTSMEEIGNTIISTKKGKDIYLRDVAEIIDGFKETSSISRLNGEQVITLGIVKRQGANLLETIFEVKEQVEKAKEEGIIPKQLTTVYTNDQSSRIKKQVSNMENNIILGMVLVIMVLYFFLGLRNALFAGLAIPLSMLISFIILKAIGYTINMMTLFALILALGMLVDNAIVIVEIVYRNLEKGFSLFQATKQGVGEIALPIISSTLTTLAAFAPLMMWEGMIGEFMIYLPVTLIIVLSSSLFVALVITPNFTSSYAKVEEGKSRSNVSHKQKLALLITSPLSLMFYLSGHILWGNLFVLFPLLFLLNRLLFIHVSHWVQNRFLPKMEFFYEQTLRYILRKKTGGWVLAGSVGLFISSIILFGASNPKILFFPSSEPQTVYVSLVLPLGTNLQQTEKITQHLEQELTKVLAPYQHIVESINVGIGEERSDFLSSGGKQPNKTTVTITFVDYEFREDISTLSVTKEITEHLEGKIEGTILIEKQQNGPPVGKPINIEITGNELSSLINVAQKVQFLIESKNIRGVEKLQMDIDPNKKEQLIEIDRKKARHYGLSTQTIASALRTAVFGYKASTFKKGEDEYDIYVRLRDKDRYSLTSLMNMEVKANLSKEQKKPFIQLSNVASKNIGYSYDKINRKNSRRVITLSSNVIEGYNANSVNQKIKRLLSKTPGLFPTGYTYKFTGEQEEQAKTSRFLAVALLTAIALILMVMVTQFNSIFKPLIIIATVLFSTIGVFLGLTFSGMPFVILMTGIGIISLAGIVVNNGIVLVDYITLTKKRRAEELNVEPIRLPPNETKEAIVKAGKTRLRPVLLTAITTILGLFPMAIGMNFDFFSLFTDLSPNLYFGGDNADFWGPMAWTVIFGLVLATFLTLLLTPLMAYLLGQTIAKVKRMFS